VYNYECLLLTVIDFRIYYWSRVCWHCLHSMWSRVYETADRPSVCLSVPSVNSSSGVWRVCCWAPCLHDISCNGRRVVACWTQAQKALVQIAAATLSGNSLRQTVHTHHASVHQAAELVAALLSVVMVTAGLVESNGSLPPGLWLASSAGWLPRTGISSETLCSVFKYGLHF